MIWFKTVVLASNVAQEFYETPFSLVGIIQANGLITLKNFTQEVAPNLQVGQDFPTPLGENTGYISVMSSLDETVILYFSDYGEKITPASMKVAYVQAQQPQQFARIAWGSTGNSALAYLPILSTNISWVKMVSGGDPYDAGETVTISDLMQLGDTDPDFKLYDSSGNIMAAPVFTAPGQVAYAKVTGVQRLNFTDSKTTYPYQHYISWWGCPGAAWPF